MSWPDYSLQFLPPAFAIYLILVSKLAGRMITNRISSFVASNHSDELKLKLPVIQNFVLSGILQIVFFNSVFAAMVSVLVILRKDSHLAAWAVLFMVGIFIPFIYSLSALNPDDLASKRFRLVGIRTMKYAFGCKLMLVVVNLILCVAIWWSSQQHTTQVTP